MTTQHKPHGAVPPAPPIEATEEQWYQARLTCSERATQRGHNSLAHAYLTGSQDEGWAMRHEMKLVLAA